jgi:hypothetical protein
VQGQGTGGAKGVSGRQDPGVRLGATFSRGKGAPTIANFIYRLGESCLEEPEDLTRRLSYQQCFGVVSKGAVELIFLSMFCF